LAIGQLAAIVRRLNAEQRTVIKLGRSGVALPAMLVVAGLLSLLLGRGRATEALPSASEVTRRMLEHARTVAESDQTPQYTYEKRSVVEQLDAGGRVLTSEEKIHEVRLIRGLPFNRLVKIQGRELTPEESKREAAREERFQQKFVSADRRKMAARKQALVTPELLARYQFVVKQRVTLNSRPTLVVAFKPCGGDLPEKSIEDKILNRMAGTLWIDEAEADTARLEATLLGSMTIGWFGWLGSLTRCDLSLTRQRMPDGVWVNDRMTLSIQCRKVIASERFRLTEESRGFSRSQARR
jgi:hypothetical protein